MNSSPTTTEEAWRKRPHEPESGSSTSQCGEETSPPPSRDRGDGGGAGTASMDEWRPSRHELLVIITLAVTNLLVALDASIVTTSLHVSKQSKLRPGGWRDTYVSTYLPISKHTHTHTHTPPFCWREHKRI